MYTGQSTINFSSSQLHSFKSSIVPLHTISALGRSWNTSETFILPLQGSNKLQKSQSDASKTHYYCSETLIHSELSPPQSFQRRKKEKKGKERNGKERKGKERERK